MFIMIRRCACSRLLELRNLLFYNRLYSFKIDTKYSAEEKSKILKTINSAEPNSILRFDITRTRLKSIKDWHEKNGHLNELSDLGLVKGFNEKIANKLFESILKDNGENDKATTKIKGQVLNPNLLDSVRQNIKTVLAVSVTTKSVCWALIDKTEYELLQWHYYEIDYPDGKKFHLTDIFDISYRVSSQLPTADIYVMKSEATTLRAAGSDPNNPKMLSVNLQRAQMIAMIVALINARHQQDDVEPEEEDISHIKKQIVNQKVYFLRPTLPFRLYGTLIGNELVSTDQTIQMLLQDIKEKCPDRSKVFISNELKSNFLSRKELEMDMMGQCLLLGLAFMDVCVYKNSDRINKLLDVVVGKK